LKNGIEKGYCHNVPALALIAPIMGKTMLKMINVSTKGIPTMRRITV